MILTVPVKTKPTHKQKIQMKPASLKSEIIPANSLLCKIHTTAQNAITAATITPVNITDI